MMLLAALSIFGLIVAGCGGGSTKASASSPSTTAPKTGGTGAAGFEAFTQCMVSHGIPASALQRTRPANTPPTTGADAGSTPATSTGGEAGGTGGNRTPPSLPAGVTQAQYQAALQACRSQLPAGGGGFGGGGANSAALAAYRNCLQLHGVTLPAAGQRPAGQPGGTGQTPASTAGSSTSQPGFGGLNTSDPTVQAAMTACASLRPARTPGSTTSTTTP